MYAARLFAANPRIAAAVLTARATAGRGGHGGGLPGTLRWLGSDVVGRDGI